MKDNLPRRGFRAFATALIMLAAAGIASAQSYYGANYGSAGGVANSSALVVNNGSSYGSAKNSESAISNLSVTTAGLPGYSGQQQTVAANTSTTSTGQAFNVANGSGAAGLSFAVGGAAAGADGWTSYGNPHQTLNLNGDASSVSGGAVIATRSTDGYYGGAATAGFTASGYVGSTGIPGGSQIVGAVNTSQYATSDAGAGGVTFEGGTPAGQSAAIRGGFANGSSVSTGSFWDPVH